MSEILSRSYVYTTKNSEYKCDESYVRIGLSHVYIGTRVETDTKTKEKFSRVICKLVGDGGETLIDSYEPLSINDAAAITKVLMEIAYVAHS